MVSERSPLMPPSFLSSEIERPPPESVANFYSPFDTTHNSDDEDDQVSTINKSILNMPLK